MWGPGRRNRRCGKANGGRRRIETHEVDVSRAHAREREVEARQLSVNAQGTRLGERRTRCGTLSAIRNRPSSVFVQLKLGTTAFPFSVPEGGAFKMPFAAGAGTETSSMSGLPGLLGGASTDSGEEAEAREGAGARRAVGTLTVRGASLPLAAMFGVPIWRESCTPYCVSMRWNASSGGGGRGCGGGGGEVGMLMKGSSGLRMGQRGRMRAGEDLPTRKVLNSGERRARGLRDALKMQSNTTDGFPAAPRIRARQHHFHPTLQAVRTFIRVCARFGNDDGHVPVFGVCGPAEGDVPGDGALDGGLAAGGRGGDVLVPGDIHEHLAVDRDGERSGGMVGPGEGEERSVERGGLDAEARGGRERDASCSRRGRGHGDGARRRLSCVWFVWN